MHERALDGARGVTLGLIILTFCTPTLLAAVGI